MSNPYYDQYGYQWGENTDSSTPDGVNTWDADNTPRTGHISGQGTQLHIRLGVNVTVKASPLGPWTLYYAYDTPTNGGTAQVTVTGDSNVKLSNDTNIADGASTTSSLIAGISSWVNGLYADTSDQTGNLALGKDDGSEFQFCIEFVDGASAGTYYFYLRNSATVFDAYSNIGQITVTDPSSSSSSISSISSSMSSSSSLSSSSVSSSSISSSSSSRSNVASSSSSSISSSYSSSSASPLFPTVQDGHYEQYSGVADLQSGAVSLAGVATADNLIVACITIDKDSGVIDLPECTGAFTSLALIQDTGSAGTNVCIRWYVV